MAAVRPAHYTSSWVVMLIGVILILVASFGVTIPVISLFEFGVGLCFAAMLVR